MTVNLRYVPLGLSVLAAGAVVSMGLRSANAGGVYLKDLILLPFVLLVAVAGIQMYRSAKGDK